MPLHCTDHTKRKVFFCSNAKELSGQALHTRHIKLQLYFLHHSLGC